MKPISAFQYLSWSQFSKPTNDRVAYRAIKKHKFRSIVEVGLGEGVRCERLIRVAQKYSGAETVRYTGIDLFEERESSKAPLKLIEMHRRLNGLGAKAQLQPGNFGNTIQRIANAHAHTDLVVVQCDTDGDVFELEGFAAAWKFLPRMLHSSSQVMLFFPANEYEVLGFVEVGKQLKKLESISETRKAA